MTYTQGPWRFSKSESSGWGLIVDSHENIIANVNSETGPDIPPLVSTKMPCKANGMVIAAAPDMLEALILLYELVSSDCVSIPDEQYAKVAFAAFAIAKAEGRAE